MLVGGIETQTESLDQRLNTGWMGGKDTELLSLTIHVNEDREELELEENETHKSRMCCRTMVGDIQ